MEFYFLNWVQLSYDFDKVVPSGITQGYFHPQTKKIHQSNYYTKRINIFLQL